MPWKLSFPWLITHTHKHLNQLSGVSNGQILANNKQQQVRDAFFSAVISHFRHKLRNTASQLAVLANSKKNNSSREPILYRETYQRKKNDYQQ